MSVTNPLKGRSEYLYNTQGSLLSHTLPNGAVINYRYDREGKITQKSNALGDSSYLLYDTQKRVQASIDAHQSKTEYFYDKTDRIIKTKDGINNEIHYQYNTQARLYRITDPVGNDTKYFYDKAGRLESELLPTKDLSFRSYNPDSTVKSITRIDRSEILFGYNELRLPSEIVYTKEHPENQSVERITQQFQYDGVGRLVTATNRDTEVKLGYNRIGKITKEQQFFSAFTIQKTSDAKTHTDTLSFAGTTVQITHDFTTRTKTLTKNNRYPITIHYDTQGIEHTLVYPNGLKEQYTFNKAHQITALETANQRLSYQYDKVGNIIQKSHIRYTYDAIGRLTGVNQHAFTYDKAGNNQNDYARYDQTTYQLLENQRYRFTYDRRGNLQTKTDKPKQETTYYRFNLLNQLTEVIIKDRDHRTIKTFRYEYDALNRRIMKQEDNQTYYYLYDGLNIIAILSETKQVLATIVHHDTKIDTPLSIHTIHGIFYYHRDHQGSIIALSDEYGDIVESIEYDGHYGSITKHWIREDIKTLNPFGYTGRETDHRDLYYYRARYYDPTVQRFLSLDPIGFAAGDFNFYRYVGNKPVRFRDPLGLAPSLGNIADTAEILEGFSDEGVKGAVDTYLEQKGLKVDTEPYEPIVQYHEKCLENVDLDFPNKLENYEVRKKAIQKCDMDYGNSIKNKYYDEKSTFGYPDQTIPGTNMPLGGQPDFLKRTNEDVNYSTEAYADRNITDTPADPLPTVPETNSGYLVCTSYDDLVDNDENVTGDVIGHYSDQQDQCSRNSQISVNPNYNTPYVENNSPYVANTPYVNSALIIDNETNLTEEEQIEKNAEAYNRGKK